MPVKLNDKITSTVAFSTQPKYTVTLTEKTVNTVTLKDVKAPK